MPPVDNLYIMGNIEPKICCKQEDVKTEHHNLPILTDQDSEHMSISKKSSRAELSPIYEVERTAYELCKETQISEFYVPLLSRIITFPHQQFFLEKWKGFTEDQRSSFLENLNDIKLDLTDTLYEYFAKDMDRQARLLAKFESAFAPEFIVQQFLDQKEKERINSAGLSLLRQNKVALVLMCAGSSSRFGSSNKFLEPLEIQNQLTILDCIFGNLRQVLKDVTRIPIIFNCNETNIKVIQEYVCSKNFFELQADCFRFTVSTNFVVVDQNEKYCLDENFRLVKRAPGTAECAENLFSQELQLWLKEEKISYVYFSGTENIKEMPCDPMLLGQLSLSKRKIGAKCTKKFPLSKLKSQSSGQSNQQQSLEPFPRYYRALNFEECSRINLLNVSEMQLLPPQKVETMPIALNSLAIDYRQLRKIVYNYQKELSQPEPYHYIKKPERILNHGSRAVQQLPCYSFERDIREYICCVQNPILYVVDRNTSFLPILTKDQEYSLQQAQIYLKARELRQQTGVSRLS